MTNVSIENGNHLNIKIDGNIVHIKNPEGKEVSIPKLPVHLQNPIAHFLHALDNDSAFQPLCRPGHCRDAQEILEAGIQSATNGAKVDLPQLAGMD
jgi:predicted dehydrogenase